MADGIRVEKLHLPEQRFLDDIERCYFTDEVRELAKKLAALPEQTSGVRLTLAIAAARGR